jgi:hypothetical protein
MNINGYNLLFSESSRTSSNSQSSEQKTNKSTPMFGPEEDPFKLMQLDDYKEKSPKQKQLDDHLSKKSIVLLPKNSTSLSDGVQTDDFKVIPRSILESGYREVKFIPGEILQMETVKITKKGIEVRRLYEKLSKTISFTTNKIHFFKCIKSSSELKPEDCKVVKQLRYKSELTEMPIKVNKESIAQGEAILKEQLKNPESGVHLKSIPGLMTPIKFIIPFNEKNVDKKQKKFEGSALISCYEGRLFYGKIMKYKQIVDLCGQLLFGVAHLHKETNEKKGIAHRDINPQNILYRKKNGKMQYSLIDFDTAHYLNLLLNKTIKPNLDITKNYISKKDVYIWLNQKKLINKIGNQFGFGKEIILFKDLSIEKQKQFYKSHDVYSLGTSLKECLMGIPAMDFVNEEGHIKPLKMKHIHKVITNKLSDEKKITLDGICKIINSMTNSDWEQRCSAEEALRELGKLGIKTPHYS